MAVPRGCPDHDVESLKYPSTLPPDGDAMISKETQYKLYAGTKKDDYTGWEKMEIDPSEADTIDFWSLDLGNGYFLDRVTKTVTGFFQKRKIKLNSVRRDRTVEDPEGDYKDMDFNFLFDVSIQVSNDAIKFSSKHNSFILLSREPVDWDMFSEGVPKFEDRDLEENWASFYS